ncbi:Mrp/NBP35 family ATP-binding protein [Thermostilla marina]
MSDSLTRENVLQACEDFQDPETGRSLVKMEQVKDVVIEGDKVTVTVGLTTFAAPLWDEITAQLTEHLKTRLPQAAEVTVHRVIEERPPAKQGQLGVQVKSVIAVGSGKGGVGKSTIATLLAFGLSRAGAKVGMIDADVYGPSVPHMLGSRGRPTMHDGKIQPVVVDGVPVMSMGFLVPEDEAVIWRGPMLHGAIQQFLGDTNWGELDYLVVDMPPGTGDVAISLSQLIPVSGAVVVCTPQEVALLDAVKAVAMFRKVNIELFGMVENMSHFICPECNARHEIFGTGGAKAKAEQLGVPFLGEVPLNVNMRVAGDAGKVVSCFEDEACRPYLENLVKNLVRTITSQRKQKPPMPSLEVLG